MTSLVGTLRAFSILFVAVSSEDFPTQWWQSGVLAEIGYISGLPLFLLLRIVKEVGVNKDHVFWIIVIPWSVIVVYAIENTFKGLRRVYICLES